MLLKVLNFSRDYFWLENTGQLPKIHFIFCPFFLLALLSDFWVRPSLVCCGRSTSATVTAFLLTRVPIDQQSIEYFLVGNVKYSFMHHLITRVLNIFCGKRKKYLIFLKLLDIFRNANFNLINFAHGIDVHTWYLSRTPRTCSCKFFWAGVNFYRFNAKNWQFTVYFAVITQKIGNFLCILS